MKIKTIVKVQIPMSQSPNIAPMALVYNKDRTFETYLDVDDELLAQMGNEPKIFFEAEIDTHSKGIWPVEKVPDPGW